MTAIDWKAKRGKCPSCGREGEDKRTGTLGIGKFKSGPRMGQLVAHCHRCQHVAWPDDAKQADEAREHHHEREQRTTLSEWGHELWASCERITGDGLAYLRARGCVVPPSDGDLRYHPALKHPLSGMLAPALVALVSDAVTREPLTLHRTWIQADGTKASLDPPRMLLSGHRKAGGVVRLWPDEAVTIGLGIAEGIETALSLAHAFKPVWACIDARNLTTFPVLAGIESLLIAADNDETGISAARTCGARWGASGCDARIAMPDRHKQDLNDVVRTA